MNILFVYPRHICPRVGGVERVTQILADAFEARGNKVFYLSTHLHPLSLPNLTDDDISPRQYFTPAKMPNGEPDMAFDNPENTAFFLKFLRERQIDIIIAQFVGAGDSMTKALSAAKSPGIPVIGCHHTAPTMIFNDDKNRTGIRKFLRERKLKKRLRAAYESVDRYVLLSKSYIPEMRKYLRGNDKKLLAISNPLTFPPAKIDLAQKKKELLFVGRLYNSEKCPDLLLKIWAKIERDFPDWKLKIVGDGPDRADLENLAGTLNLRERIEFCGFQKPEPFYRDASIFCMTSAKEGFGMVLIEAAAYACVPVAFDSCAVFHDIITDDENGKLVPAFDLDKYAETLKKMMCKGGGLRRLATAAQRDVVRFSRENIVAQWEQLFKELLNEK